MASCDAMRRPLIALIVLSAFPATGAAATSTGRIGPADGNFDVQISGSPTVISVMRSIGPASVVSAMLRQKSTGASLSPPGSSAHQFSGSGASGLSLVFAEASKTPAISAKDERRS